MWRLALLLLVIATAACVLAWLVSGKPRYKLWALRLGWLGLAAVLLFFGLLMIERLFG
jgi:hypothetical protein